VSIRRVSGIATVVDTSLGVSNRCRRLSAELPDQETRIIPRSFQELLGQVRHLNINANNAEVRCSFPR
jgi:hypothetical protein